MATQTILDGTTTTSPSVRFDRWGRASVSVSGATSSNTVVMEGRPAGESAPWVALADGVWDSPEVRLLRVDAAYEYRFRAGSAGPTARITTELGIIQ